MAKPSTNSAPAEAPQNDIAMPDAQESTPPTTESSTTTAQPSHPTSTAPEPSQPAVPSEPAPIVPGPRAQQLLNLHARALTATLRTISPSTFSACFPTIAAAAPDVLKSIHTQFISRLQTFAEADLKEILRERKVVENLNGLEELIADSKRRKDEAERRGDAEVERPVPGHLQAPEKLLEAHLIGTLEMARSRLNAREQTLMSVNQGLFEGVKEQWREIEELTKGLEGLVGDLEGVGEMVGEL